MTRRGTGYGARGGSGQTNPLLQQPGGLSAGSRRRAKGLGSSGSGYPRRRSSNVGGWLLALVLLVGIAAGGWYWYSLPVTATIIADPSDAIILACGERCEGLLETTEMPVGEYEVSISRPGFEALDTTIDITRFGENRFELALEALPHAIAVEANPAEAQVTISRDAEVMAEASGAASCTVPAGPILVTATLAGHNTVSREYFLDDDLSIEVWLDPEGQAVEGRGVISASGAPKGVAISPDGSEVWATILNGPPSIEIFSIATGRKVDSITLADHGAVEVVFSADGTRAWASQMETARVYEIETSTREVRRTLETGSSWSKVVELAPDETALYVANWSGDDVSLIDLETGQLKRRISTADTPRGLYATADGRALYVASFNDGVLERIDLESNTLETVFDGGGALRHIVGDPERGVVFVSDMAKDCIWIHDITTGETELFTETDEKPNTIDLSPDGEVLFVSCRGENNPVSYYMPGPEWGTVLLFDSTDATPLDAIVGGNQCTALDVSRDGGMLVFSDFLDDRLRMYHVPSYADLLAAGGGRWDEHFAALNK